MKLFCQFEAINIISESKTFLRAEAQITDIWLVSFDAEVVSNQVWDLSLCSEKNIYNLGSWSENWLKQPQTTECDQWPPMVTLT